MVYGKCCYIAIQKYMSCSSVSSSLTCTSKGRLWAMLRRAYTVRSVPTGPMMETGSVLPMLPMVSSSPGNPLMWSACKWVMSILSTGLRLSPAFGRQFGALATVYENGVPLVAHHQRGEPTIHEGLGASRSQ